MLLPQWPLPSHPPQPCTVRDAFSGPSPIFFWASREVQSLPVGVNYSQFGSPQGLHTLSSPYLPPPNAQTILAEFFYLCLWLYLPQVSKCQNHFSLFRCPSLLRFGASSLLWNLSSLMSLWQIMTSVCPTPFVVPRLGLPRWRSGWESACQCRTHGFKPWSRKISHAAEQLSPWATTTEPACHNYWACALEPVNHNYWACAPRARAPQQEEPPFSATRESPRAGTKTQSSQK